MQLKPQPFAFVLALLLAAVPAVLFLTGQFNEIAIASAFFPARILSDSADFSSLPFVVPAILTPITTIFFSTGFLNLLISVLIILLLGTKLEAIFGWLGFGLLCLAGCYAAALPVWVADPQSMIPLIGPEGIFSAVIAAYLMLFSNQYMQNWGSFAPNTTARPFQLLGMWTALQLVFMLLSPGAGLASILPSIGGFIAGLMLARPLLLWRYRKA